MEGENSHSPTEPDRFDAREARRLLSLSEKGSGIVQRIESLSAALLGRPYLTSPLRGGPDQPEAFVIDLQGFDCVTFVETVLALALSSSAADAPERLRELRYAHGRIDWLDRNHYMSGWLQENARKGFVETVPPARPEAVPRLLSCLPGYPACRREIVYCPLSEVPRWRAGLLSGDLLFFVSLREDLDVFHLGILVRTAAGEPLLRHAAKSRGAVIEERLDDFLARNEMAGLIAARPVGGAS